jgi:hypothetical protein
MSALPGQVTESCVQFAVTFLATRLADVTMLIAHHLPELRREAPAWAQDPGRVRVSQHGRPACNSGCICVQRECDVRTIRVECPDPALRQQG